MLNRLVPRPIVRCLDGVPALVAAAVAWVCLALAPEARGQVTAPATSPDAPPVVPQTVFHHSNDSRWFVSGQINVISQAHGPFDAPYSGPHSLRPDSEAATSLVSTLYTGVQWSRYSEILLHIENTAGRGLSDSYGVAGFPNYDAVRNPTLSATPYVARFLIHHVIALGDGVVRADRGPLGILTTLPAHRVEISAGKLSTADYFDTNSSTGDSRFAFMNWTVNNNGAYDWAADTRGYTVGIVVQYVAPRWAARFGEALMPKVANGMDLQWDPLTARGTNLEVELHPRLAEGRETVIRLLAFRNTANMGNYREAIAAFEAGQDPVPDIVAHRAQGRVKYGGGVNVEQAVSDSVRVFGRAGWSDGRTESFVFTEVDRSAMIGFDVRGSAWRRPSDRVGVAYSANGLSSDHRRYLALGGLGFLLGDGRLAYGREHIVEGYYTVPLVRGIYAAGDLQFVLHPAYNRDRGPVVIASARLHLGL